MAQKDAMFNSLQLKLLYVKLLCLKTSKRELIESSRGLVAKGVGVVIKFRVRIPKRSLVVLERAYNLKMLLCYLRKPCSVASIVGYPFVTSNERKPYSSGVLEAGRRRAKTW